MIDRTTFYSRADGSQMDPGEMLAHLLEIGNLTSDAASALAHCSSATIEHYRKPSAGRPVPERYLVALELYVFDRLKRLARAAGYNLRKAA